MELRELLIVIFGIPRLLAAGCVSERHCWSGSHNPGVSIAIRILMVTSLGITITREEPRVLYCEEVSFYIFISIFCRNISCLETTTNMEDNCRIVTIAFWAKNVHWERIDIPPAQWRLWGFVAPGTAVNFSDCQSSESLWVSQRLAFVPQVEPGSWLSHFTIPAPHNVS